jgi:acyl carrier protein
MYREKQLKDHVGEYLGIDAQGVMDEAHFSDDLGIDWLDPLELMILIEDKFPGVEITNKDADQIQVVGDLSSDTSKIMNRDCKKRENSVTIVRGSAP